MSSDLVVWAADLTDVPAAASLAAELVRLHHRFDSGARAGGRLTAMGAREASRPAL